MSVTEPHPMAGHALGEVFRHRWTGDLVTLEKVWLEEDGWEVGVQPVKGGRWVLCSPAYLHENYLSEGRVRS